MTKLCPTDKSVINDYDENDSNGMINYYIVSNRQKLQMVEALNVNYCDRSPITNENNDSVKTV